MTLFREDVSGNEILTTRPIIKPVEKFLDIHPGIDEKVQRVHERRFSRRANPFFDEDLRTDLFIALLHNRVQNRENFTKSLRIARGN